MWQYYCYPISVQLQLTAVYNSSIEVNYTCSTIYTTPINIKITDRSGLEYRTVCTNGSFRFALDDDHCGDVNLCGYFTNGTTLTDCPLACDSVSIACPTATTAEPRPTHCKSCYIYTLVVIDDSELFWITCSPSKHYCGNRSQCGIGICSLCYYRSSYHLCGD